MKQFLILAAVLLSAMAAKVPPSLEIASTMAMPVSTTHKSIVEVPTVEAHVVEVSPPQTTPSGERTDKATKVPLTEVTTSTTADKDASSAVGVNVVLPDPGKDHTKVPVVVPVVEAVVTPLITVPQTARVPLIKDTTEGPITVARKMRAALVMEEVKPIVEPPQETVLPNVVVPKVPVDPAMGSVDMHHQVAGVSHHQHTTSDAGNSCDLQCTKFDLNPVCASNGDCLHEFPNQCVMDTFNCKHPEVGFKATNDEKCRMHWLKQCTEQELMG